MLAVLQQLMGSSCCLLHTFTPAEVDCLVRLLHSNTCMSTQPETLFCSGRKREDDRQNGAKDTRNRPPQAGRSQRDPLGRKVSCLSCTCI